MRNDVIQMKRVETPNFNIRIRKEERTIFQVEKQGSSGKSFTATIETKIFFLLLP